MKTWDERYASSEYIYGTDANAFIKEQLNALPKGKILFPAEGEGRNAVYAAKEAWEVYAFDPSGEAQKKALRLAEKANCKITYEIADVLNYETEPMFDCIAIAFMHLPSGIRPKAHQRLLGFLKPGGKLILEVFHKEQLPLSSGGPKDLDLLYDEESLSEDFKEAKILMLEKTETVLDEGKLHQGKAKVIRLIAEKL